MTSCQPQLRAGMLQSPQGRTGAAVTADQEARSGPGSPSENRIPTDWGVRAMTDAKRVDARTARLAVSRVMNPDGRSLLRVDSALFGGADWAKAVFENVGLSVRQEGDILLVESRGGDDLRDALRRSLKPIHRAMDRARGNLRKAEIVGARQTIGGLECSFETGVAVVAFRGDGERIDDSQGRLTPTGRALDVAIRGRGMFVVQTQLDGSPRELYTRNGRMSVDAEGRLCIAASGEALMAGEIRIPKDSEELTISKAGEVSVRMRGQSKQQTIGMLQVASFEHPGCLEETIPGFYAWTPAAGRKIDARTGEAGIGVIEQRVLEESNVSITDSWAWLSLLEDARQLVLAMAETMDTDNRRAENGASSPTGGAANVRRCDQTVVIRMPDCIYAGTEGMLAKLLRIRGVDNWSSAGGVELPRSRAAASVLVEYLGLLRARLDIIAENISGAHGPLPGRTREMPYLRKTLRLSEAGEAQIVEDAAPFGVRWEIVPNLATGFAMPMLVESTNVSMETELEDSDRTTREYRAVREALAEMGREAVPALAAELVSERAHAAIDAAYALGQIGREAVGAVPALLEALDSVDRPLRNAAAAALMHIAPDSPLVVDRLIETWSALLANDDWRLRREAVEALGRMGPRAAPCVPALIALLDDPASGAALTLAEIGPGAKIAVGPLVSAMSNSDTHVRMQAAYALGRLGSEAREALPTLLAAMYDTNKDVRTQALAAVGQIGGRESGCLAAIATVLRDEDETVRRRVAAALGSLGAWADALADDRIVINPSGLRAGAQAALESVGVYIAPVAPLARTALAVAMDAQSWRPLLVLAAAHVGWGEQCDVRLLIELAGDQDGRVAASAMDALGALGSGAAQAVAMLSAALEHESPWIRRAAAQALGRIGEAAAVAVPSLEAHLTNETEQVATAAAVALGRIGEPASEASDALRTLSYHHSPTVRSAAMEALERVAAQQATATVRAAEPQRRVAVTAEQDGAF